MKQATLAAVAMSAAGLTPSGLADLLLRVTDIPASTEGVNRVKGIIDPLCNMALSDARSLLTEAVKTIGEKDSPKYRTTKQRASDARNILGAVKLVPGFSYEGMMWQQAVEKARATLAEHNLTNSGGKVLSDEERAAKALAEATAEAVKAEVISGGNMNGTVQYFAEKAAKNVHDAEIAAHAGRIIKARGAEYALDLAAQLIEQTERLPQEKAVE